MFPSIDWTAYYEPHKLFISNNGSTMYTIATYYNDGISFQGIGIIPNITAVSESSIISKILTFNTTVKPTTTPLVTQKSRQVKSFLFPEILNDQSK